MRAQRVRLAQEHADWRGGCHDEPSWGGPGRSGSFRSHLQATAAWNPRQQHATPAPPALASHAAREPGLHETPHLSQRRAAQQHGGVSRAPARTVVKVRDLALDARYSGHCANGRVALCQRGRHRVHRIAGGSARARVLSQHTGRHNTPLGLRVKPPPGEHAINSRQTAHTSPRRHKRFPLAARETCASVSTSTITFTRGKVLLSFKKG